MVRCSDTRLVLGFQKGREHDSAEVDLIKSKTKHSN